MADLRSTRPKRAMRGTLRQSQTPAAWTIVGFAHVIVGAIATFSVLVGGVFGAEFPPPGLLLLLVFQGAQAAGLVMGGLWLADGRKRGAILSVGIDVVRCLFLVAGGQLFSIDLLVAAAMGVAAVWVMPMLEAERAR